MVVLVTGSSGFVGRNLTRYLKANNLDVIGLDSVLSDQDTLWTNDPSKSISQNDLSGWLASYGLSGVFQYRLGRYENITVQDSMLEKLQGVNAVIHLAGQNSVSKSISNPRNFIDDNIGGTVELLEIARRLPNLEKIILLSSYETVGSLESGNALENAGYKCESIYAATKAAQELLIQAYCNTHNMKTLTVRSVNIFGPEQSEDKFIPTVIRSALSGDALKLYGNGFQSRQWVSVDHVCEVLNWAALNTIIPDGKTIHITGTDGVPNYLLAATIFCLMNKPININHIEDRLGHEARLSLGSDESHAVWDIPQFRCDGKYVTNYQDQFMNDLKTTIAWYKNYYAEDYGG
jgi:dTDP-glucose 4,6-dehydratase